MKRPWLSVALFCFVLSSILIFSILMGGYSNLVRTQNRIGATKDYMTEQCQALLDLVPELISISRGAQPAGTGDPAHGSQTDLNQVNGLAQEARTKLDQINSQEKLLEKELISAFEHSQVQLSRALNTLILELNNDEKIKASQAFIDLEKKIKNLEIMVFQISGRYNKEVRYFNQRKEVFPGSLVAKLSGMDQIRFLEITASLFEPAKPKG